MANTRLIEYSDIKDEFLYTVTHELRTPLTAIRAQAEILADEDDMPTEDQQIFLNSIVKECERLTNLITNVLDLEKFESGSQQLNLTKQSLAEVLEEATEGLKHLMTERNIKLQNQVDDSHEPFYFDKDRIIQVLVNLISNAIKFCNPERGEIIVNAYEFNNDIKIDVIDNGTGIKSEEVELVFDKFYQIKHQTRKKPTGSGLGLAICKNIIQMHGGKIWVQPEPTGGTRFSFTLPYNTQLKHPENTTLYEKDSNR